MESHEQTPISQRIPPEILSEIFLRCTEGWIAGPNTLDTPLLISKICSTWRHVAINTPRIWSRISVAITTSNSERQAARVSAWLERSGGCPLTLQVFWDDPPFFDSHPVLETLARHSFRWKDSLFYLPLPAFKSLSRLRGKLPMLEELSLGDTSIIDYQWGVEVRPLDIFAMAPSLRSMECVNVSPLVFQLPWTQLLTIPIVSVFLEDCIEILKRCSSLEKGTFICLRGHSLTWPARITHRRIRDLSIVTAKWDEFVDLSNLFRSFTFPSLQTIKLCNILAPLDSTFVNFLSRTRSLQCLHLRNTSLSDEHLVQCLRAAPSLARLVIENAPRSVTAYLLNELTIKSGHGSAPHTASLAPKLEAVELTIPLAMGQLFVDMVRSRVELNADSPDGISRLESVVINDFEGFTPGTTEQIIEFMENGLSVTCSPSSLPDI